MHLAVEANIAMPIMASAMMMIRDCLFFQVVEG